MPRRDPSYNAFDVLRIVENNLTVAETRLVFAWFYSTIPIKEPKVDVVGILLALASAVPVVGSLTRLFQIGVSTAQVAVDIADLFEFGFDEEEVELAKALSDLRLLREEFEDQRQDLQALQQSFDNLELQADALRATLALVEQENAELAAQLQEEGPRATRIRIAVRNVRELVRTIRANAGALRGLGRPEPIFIDNGAQAILEELFNITGEL